MADSENNDLEQFVAQQIENLRPRLLDLTRHNPLLSTPFSERTHANVRVVDEVPTILFERLVTGKMRVVPLPPLEEDPKDEQTREFQSALSDARLVEEAYLAALDEIDEDSDEAPQQLINVERELKDRLREGLGLPPRQTSGNLSLAQHARNNFIRPSYELPSRDEQDEDGRHTDNDIQTLLLPDLFERRLNSISTKCRTWLQETGISVFHVAFGFLEWGEVGEARSSFAPLILMPATIEKKRAPRGPAFWISGEENVDSNVVLAEKFRKDDIDFPKYEPGIPVEEYFEIVAEAAPPGRTWKVRRQVAVGVFPSARMAMYHDLDTSNWQFGKHQVMLDLLGGNAPAGGSPFADDYMVDEPEIEAKVPLLVMDADSSQFSTVVDAMDGKNLAIEGPPGTGKSQTIVNIIAAAMFAGKRVLFVAEKTAALDVVRSRLNAAGVGEFILPLLATRSGRADVIQSIRERIEMAEVSDPKELDQKIDIFRKTRAEIAEYIAVVSAQFGETGLTVFDVLGRQICLREELGAWPVELQRHIWPEITKITDTRLKELTDLAQDIEQAAQACKSHPDHWKAVKVRDIDPYRLGEVLEAVTQCLESFEHNVEVREKLNDFDLNEEDREEQLRALHRVIHGLGNDLGADVGELAKRLLPKEAINLVKDFLEQSSKARKERDKLTELCVNPLAENLVEDLQKLAALLEKIDLPEISTEQIARLTEERQESVDDLKAFVQFLEEAISIVPEASGMEPQAIFWTCRIAERISREALALRNKDMENPLAWEAVDKARKKIEGINEKRSLIEGVFALDETLNHVDATKHAGVLAASGFLGFLTKDYRVAKKFYRAISKRPKFDKSSAVAELRDLATWLAEVSEIESDQKLEKLMGLQFDGVESDFKTVGELVEFYTAIDDSLSRARRKPLRAFLKRGDSEAITSLPRTDGKTPIVVTTDETIDAVKARLDRESQSLSELGDDLTLLNELIPILASPEGETPSQARNLGQKIEKLQSDWHALANNEGVRDLLGEAFFKGPDTTESEIAQGVDIATRARELGDKMGHALIESTIRGDTERLAETLGRVFESDEKAQEAFDVVAKHVETDTEVFRGGRSRKEIVEWMGGAVDDREGLVAHSRLEVAKWWFSNKGYGFFLDALEKEEIEFDDIAYGLEALIANAMAREVFRDHGSSLAKFNGARLDALRTRLAETDHEILSLSRLRVRSMLTNTCSPPVGIGRGLKRDWTELSLLEFQINKTQRYAAPRDLTRRAGKALLELKPCWMMSPLAVAQYIKKGDIEFDLVIIDEASQMTPENAIGALVRGKQAIVVGDTNQLPPTSFFRTMIATDDDDDEQVVADESILERANGAFRPGRRLRWHYRSRHSGLIAFSNRRIYDDKLIVFPSASEEDPTMGVSYVKVDGLYSSGTNPKEAQAMVDAIIQFMRKHDDRSLGVVTVNQKQRDLILEEFEYALAQNNDLVRYIEKWEEENDGLETFFIKNLENVQGDERDVIFIGTVYGPESPGARVMQRFGPIAGIAGKRRLNVLFTRAKKQVVTFSSMTSADIRAEEGGNPGAYLLKRWLEYSATGVLDGGVSTAREPDSEFEEYVIKQIEAMGCEAVPQVGASGYFIDIGVKHPNWPHGFILGVECDGASYHSSKSARDRDRLRQEVLEGLGWHFHRIWSTDWFEDPSREADRMRQAIETRLDALVNQSDIEPEEPELDEIGIDEELEEESLFERLPDSDDDEDEEPASEEVLQRIDKEEARNRLIKLRETEVMDEFPEDRGTGILRKSMIKAFLQTLPEDESEFRTSIPLEFREKTDPRQMKYLPAILEIINLVES